MPIKLAKKFTDKTNLGNRTRIYKGLKGSSWGRKEWMRLAVSLLVCGAIGYITFGTFASSTTRHPDGSLVQFGDASIYMIQGGQKRGITSEDAFNSNHYNWGMVTAGNADDAALPYGPNIGIRAGTLIMTPGNPTVWVVYDNGYGNYTKLGIPSPAIFDSLGYNYNQVLTVPPSELPPDSPSLITGGSHTGGQFVVSGGIVYMVSIGGKYRVADPSVLNTYNFPLYTAVPGDDAAPVVGFLPFHEGTLVKGSTNSVYMIGCANSGGMQGVCSMQKHGFTDEETFYGLGYNFNEVLTSPDANVDSIPTGANVSFPTPCLPSNPLCTPAGTNATPPPPPTTSTTPPTSTCLPGNPLCTPSGTNATPPSPSGTTTATPPTSTCLPNNPLCTPAGTNATPPTPTTPPTTTCLPGNPLCTPDGSLKGPSGNIDSPLANAKVSGMVNIAGWALDNSTKPETNISSISVTIEGHPAVGTLTRNITRLDVCSRYPFRPGCPYVGWQFSWNSASVPNGTFEIEVKLTDTDLGGYHTTTLTRNVTTNNPIPPSGAIYSPDKGSHVTGLVIIHGWAMDNEVKPEHDITSVKISVNGQLVGNATYGREDSTTDTVCINYPNRPGCPKIGWSFALDTTQYQSGSTLNVKATITDADTPPASTTIGTTYVVGTGQAQTCPPGQTGTPPNCTTVPAGGTGASRTIQVVYAYPSDMSPSSVELKNIPAGISQFQAFLKKSTAGVIPTQPNGVSVNMSSTIARVALPKTTLKYEQDAGMKTDHSAYIGDRLAGEIESDLSSKLPTANDEIYLVFVDGAYQDAGCGFGGGAHAIWLLNATQWGDKARNIPSIPCEDRGSNNYLGGPMPYSYFQNLGPFHELIHSLGEVASCEPAYDTDPNHNPGHLSPQQDLMHWILEPPPEYFDAKHNNYYGPNLPDACPGITVPEASYYFNTL